MRGVMSQSARDASTTAATLVEGSCVSEAASPPAASCAPHATRARQRASSAMRVRDLAAFIVSPCSWSAAALSAVTGHSNREERQMAPRVSLRWCALLPRAHTKSSPKHPRRYPGNDATTQEVAQIPSHASRSMRKQRAALPSKSAPMGTSPPPTPCPPAVPTP